jgi:UV excision repair protein RAD23
MQTNEPSSLPKTGALDFLKTQPQFLQLRRVVHDNHHLLPAVLKKIEDTNPSLLKLITDNKDEFLRILNEDTLEPGRSLHTLPMPGAGAGTAAPVASNEAEQTRQTPPQPPQQSARTTITVTTQEKEAIERLKALGFSEHLVLQAYFACDKNELQAADFLLSQDDDAETL